MYIETTNCYKKKTFKINNSIFNLFKRKYYCKNNDVFLPMVLIC